MVPLKPPGKLSDKCWLKGGVPIQKQTAITPDEPDAPDAKSYPARPWKRRVGVRCVECVGLFGGFFLTLIQS